MRIYNFAAGIVLAFGLDTASAQETPTPAAATPAVRPDAVPAVKDRGAADEPAARVAINGFSVQGVGQHDELAITPESIQAFAQAEYARLAAESGAPVKLSFAQLQAVADKITERYKKAGFVVARAYLPAQTIGEDKIVRIDVLEGAIGKIIVKGAKHYSPSAIAAPADQLRGRPVLKDEVDSALLYARDLPGVSVSATFQPGDVTGDTDLVLLANEAPRPIAVTVGGSNYGTQFTGRYRGQAGVTWNSPLGIGDQFTGKVEYAFDPSNNVYGAATYRLPLLPVPGLALLVGATRNELHINNGSLRNVDIKGPTSVYFGGAEWKFINNVDLQIQGQFLYTYEQSKLDSAATQLANEKFDVLSVKFLVNRTDRALNGVDLVELGVRQAAADNTVGDDLVSQNHSKKFTTAQFAYTRLQFLTKAQRLLLKFNGQYTPDRLIPLEQFVIGGPDSVRAYPIADALRDRGYYTSLEYHVDAPGFGDIASPFYGRPWRELLEFEFFGDYAKGFATSGSRNFGVTNTELSGAGAGVIFRIPKFYQFLFHLQAAAPLGKVDASDGNDYHIYGQLSFTF